MHLSEEHLAVVVHEERSRLPAGAASHLASCAECTSRVESLRRADREVGDWLRSIDHPAPAARSPDSVIAPATRHRRAAAIIAVTTLVAAAAAAAIPASPLHKALVRAIARGGAPTAVPIVTAPAASAQKTGIAFTPSGAVEVRFANPQPRDRVRVVFTDAEDVSATATGDAGFSLHQRRLDIDDKGVPMSFTLEIPRRLASARLLANDKLVFAAQGGTVLGSAVPDASGGYVVDLSKASTVKPQP